VTTADHWYPLLALLEQRRPDEVSAGSPPSPAQLCPTHRIQLDGPPSAKLRDAILSLCQALREEVDPDGNGQQLWLLLDTGATGPNPSPLEVSRVLDELSRRFQELQPNTSVPDFEAFLREKMLSLGFDDLGTAPLLPDLQREALRGLGVGIGSQMAQLLGRLAGWHKDPNPPKAKEEEASRPSTGIKLLRLELGTALASDRAFTASLRVDIGKTRRMVSQRLGWEVTGIGLAVSKDLPPGSWRLLLRGEQVAAGSEPDSLVNSVEQMLLQRADALFPFAEFDFMLRQPGCKLVVKELRNLGLEKAMVWTICRRVLAAGGHLREPLTVLERILEASTTSHDLAFLVQSVLSEE
jgi:hypothetical protein